MENTSLTFEILLSCMNQIDFSLVRQSNIHSDVLVINQCDRDEIIEETTGENKWRMICSTQRGLSRSRNMAIECAKGDIILFADNDEVFVDEVKEIVLHAFSTTDADIIVFDLSNKPKNLKEKVYKIHLLDTLKLTSGQIACRKESIKKIKLRFDVCLGAGTPNGGGEESKFMWDAYKNGLTIFHYPVDIASLRENESTWFKGFDKDYFFKRGKVTGYYMGNMLAFIYAIYFLVTKHHLYKQECGFLEAFKSLVKGIRSEKNFSDI